MGKKKRLTDQEKIDLVEDYITGEYNYAVLSQKYSISRPGIIGLLKRRNIVLKNFKRKFSLNQNYFDYIDTEGKAYFLGLMYADGYNNEKRECIEIQLQEDDKHILEEFNKELDSGRPLSLKEESKKNPKHKNTYRLSALSSTLSKRLAELGCPQAKSFKLKFPTSDIVPDHLLKHFIRGYFDGDGCFTYSRSSHILNDGSQSECIFYRIYIVSTEDFCISLGEFFKNKFGFHYGISKRFKERDSNTRTLVITGKKTFTILDWLYEDANFYLIRKYNKFMGQIQK